MTKSPGSAKLGGIRQWIESINDTLKGQLSPEQHGGHIPAGVWARICQRVIALAAGVWHNWTLWEHGLIDAPAATSSTTTTDPMKTESVIYGAPSAVPGGSMKAP